MSNWDVSHVTDHYGFNELFLGCINFNQDISMWDVSNVVNMKGIFYGCSTFNQDLSQWDISNVVPTGTYPPIESGLKNIFAGTAISTTNYSNMIIAWALLTVQYTIEFGAGSIKYNAGAVASRAVLTGAPNSWTITDGGLE
jgi:surface protein